MIHAIARFSFRHRFIVIFSWLIALVVISGIAGGLGPKWLEQGSLEGTESTKALELIQKNLPDQESSATGMSGSIVLKSDDSLENHREEIDAYFAKVLKDKKVTKVVNIKSPFDYDGQMTSDKKIAFATVEFEPDAEIELLGKPTVNRAKDLREDITVEFSGYAFAEFEFPASELIGIGAALVILLLAFGSLIAAGLPIFSALVGIGIGGALITIWSHLIGVPNFTTNVAQMISIGVGIDYALFIVTRYREALKRGHDREAAVMEAMTTAGAAVLFAGLTVVISLLGMLVINIDFINGLAIGTSTSVFVMVLASLTFVPAILATKLIGKNLDRMPPRTTGIYALSVLPLFLAFLFDIFVGGDITGVLYLVGLALIIPVFLLVFFNRKKLITQHVKSVPDKPLIWVRWSEFIQRRSWFAAIAGVSILVILAIPLFSLRVGVSDEGNGKEKLTTKRAYDILAEGFGPGFNGPIYTVVDLSKAKDPAVLLRIVGGLEESEGIVQVIPSSQMILQQSLANQGIEVTSNASSQEQQAALNEISQSAAENNEEGSDSPQSAIIPIQIFPKYSPQSVETSDLVHELRDETVPELVKGTGAKVYLGGLVAGNIDFADVMAEKVPLFIGAVLLLSFLLLMAVFRSVLVALKAVIMNLLSIGAAYGVIVAIFQWGWLRSLFGVGAPGPIEPWAPMMLFAIVFGLSMDYEVFLLSKIKEEYDDTKDNAGAVTHGLAATARVITAAAIIMVFVFGSFVLADDRALKLMGLGLSVAVLLDATIVRMLLVPATMELLGDRNWWMPKWLDKIIPQIHVERVQAELPSSQGEETPAQA